MTLDERLKFCRICTNRRIDSAVGLVCNLTNIKPAFESTCASIVVDQPEANRLIALEQSAKAQEDAGYFATEKKGIDKGVLGGVVMIAIAVIWFGVGWAAGYIYFYPPILFVIGLYALVKGLMTGNIAGNNKQ
jgi:hypothetical protein